MIRVLLVAALVFFGLLAFPDVAHACPVCFDSSDENRKAFLVTAAFLTVLPLGMVTGAGLWLRKRARQGQGTDVPPPTEGAARPGA